MPLILPGNVATATASTAYSIDNSCRFDGSTSYLQKTSTSDSPTLATKATFSFWAKSCSTAEQFITYTNGASSPYFQMRFGDANSNIWIQDYHGGNSYYVISSQKIRDPAAWYHFIYSYDSTPSTPSSSSIKVFINGVQVTALANGITATYPSQNTAAKLTAASVTLPIGTNHNASAGFFNGYMAEVMLVDGQALNATDFGEFDEDSPTIWKPIDISGITLGNQGFYLDFKDSANLGNDVGGGTDFTENNIAAADQSTDTPTNNFCTMNPLDNYYAGATFSEGNCKIVTGSAYTFLTGTIALSAGKWYYEVKSISENQDLIGICQNPTASNNKLGHYAKDYGYGAYNGKITEAANQYTYGDTYTDDDIIGIYIDLDNSKFYAAKNGTIQNSGTGYSIQAIADTHNGHYFPSFGDNDTASGTYGANFGGCPAFAISSGNADANGYGNFEYDPSSGTFDGASKDFLAICTKNLGSDGG